MNRTNFEHAGYALVMMLLIFLITMGNYTAGTTFPIAFFFSREMAQNEYEWIEKHSGHRADMPDLIGLDMRLWSLDSKLDFIFPAVTCIILWWIFKLTNLDKLLFGMI